MPELVSILIAAHDSERWVADALESALAQDWPATEVIAADDGSTDRTREVLASFGPAIRWIPAPHRGANPTRDLLLAEARGEWVGFLDADDTIPPDKIRRQMDVAARSRADVIVSPFRQEGVVCGRPVSPDWWVELSMGRMGITSSNLWRKPAVIAAGSWGPPGGRLHDYVLLFRMLRAGARVAVCPTALADHRYLNPRSVYHRNLPRSLRQQGILAVWTLALLHGRGELTPERRLALTDRAWHFARALWESGPREYGRDIERALVRVLPDHRDRLGVSGRVWPRLYRHLGFEAAEHYDVMSRRVRALLKAR